MAKRTEKKKETTAKGKPTPDKKKDSIAKGPTPKDKKETHKRKEPSKDDPPREAWSKSKKKRMRQKMGKMTKAKTDGEPADEKKPTKKQKVDEEAKSEPKNERGNLSSLQKSFMARLTGSRFRLLNEELYTTTSELAFEKFSSTPELYEQYHEGFRHQVEQWPINPVNAIVKWLAMSYAEKGSCVVADFGCGDAALAKKLLDVVYKGKCPFKVHSFDLVAACDLVTACDMSNVPLKNKSVDVAVFCLSLMGTNLADFIREAHRILKADGILKIAEVRSRFESKKDELEDFIDVLEKLGFKCTRKDSSNKMFVMLELRPSGKKPDKKLEYTAKACIYKRR